MGLESDRSYSELPLWWYVVTWWMLSTPVWPKVKSKASSGATNEHREHHTDAIPKGLKIEIIQILDNYANNQLMFL